VERNHGSSARWKWSTEIDYFGPHTPSQRPKYSTIATVEILGSGSFWDRRTRFSAICP
jgi:hypothetical protein